MISYKRIVEGWDAFFFMPQPTESIALFRILWATLLFTYFIFDLNSIELIYGPEGILSVQTVRSQFQYPHLNVFNIFGNSYSAVYGLFVIYGIALFTTLIGFYTRTSLFIVLCCLVSLHHRNIWVTSSSETLMRIMTILLLVSPCGHSLSVDSLLGRKYQAFKKDKDWAPWALRLIQIQLSVLYIWTVWQKLKGETWFDGTAVYYATRLESMKNFPVPYILDNLAITKIMTWGTLILEASLGILIWIKECRKAVIALGILFHLGIEYMMNIPFFEWTTIVLLLTFFTPMEIREFIFKLRDKWIGQIESSPIDEKVKNGLIWVMRKA